MPRGSLVATPGPDMGAYTNRAVAPASRTRPLLIRALETLLLAAFAYVPLLLTKPGVVAADTKQYLYLDPGRLLRSAISMWDPSVAAGTVTHQNIGYLFPQGPFYWVFAQLGVPVWVAQRLWMGTLLFAAGAGVLYLARTLGVNGPGAVVAGLGLRAEPVLPPVHRADLGHPAPLGGARVAGRLRGARGAPGRMALPGPVRARRGARGSDQRHVSDLRRHRASGVACSTRCSFCTRRRRAGPWCAGLQHGRALARSLAVLDRRAAHRRRLRRQRSASTPRRSRPSPEPRSRPRSCAGSATGTSTGATGSGLAAGGRQARGARLAPRHELRFADPRGDRTPSSPAGGRRPSSSC